MNKQIVLACDLGGTNLRMAAVSAMGEILNFRKAQTPKMSDAAVGGQAVISARRSLI